eukprot:1501447-Pyramimonas_sp.AAC.1
MGSQRGFTRKVARALFRVLPDSATRKCCQTGIARACRNRSDALARVLSREPIATNQTKRACAVARASGNPSTTKRCRNDVRTECPRHIKQNT